MSVALQHHRQARLKGGVSNAGEKLRIRDRNTLKCRDKNFITSGDVKCQVPGSMLVILRCARCASKMREIVNGIHGRLRASRRCAAIVGIIAARCLIIIDMASFRTWIF